MPMSTYYTRLEVDENASQAEIDAAYAQQRERYDPERVAHMGDDMLRVARERTAELEQIYHILSDPQRRRQYDVSIGIATPEQSPESPQRPRSLSSRELLYIAAGVVVALVVIAVTWTLTGREQADGVAGMDVVVAEVDRPAPDFTLPTLDGTDIQLEDYRGQVVLLNFWGTWCEPCRREMPALQASYEQLRDEGFTIIGINLADNELAQGRTEEDIREFSQQYGITYPVALDMEGEVSTAYRLFPLPTSYFVDAQGRIRYIRVGELTLEDVTTIFARLQQESTALRQ